MRRVLASLWILAGLLQSGAADAADCVDVEMRAERIPGHPLDALSLHFGLVNCGDAGLAQVGVTLERDGTLLGAVEVKRFLQADRQIKHELGLPIPRAVPAGNYRMCVTVSLGSASDSACATLELDDEGNVLAFAPEVPTSVKQRTWSELKRDYGKP